MHEDGGSLSHIRTSTDLSKTELKKDTLRGCYLRNRYRPDYQLAPLFAICTSIRGLCRCRPVEPIGNSGEGELVRCISIFHHFITLILMQVFSAILVIFVDLRFRVCYRANLLLFLEYHSDKWEVNLPCPVSSDHESNA